MAPRRECGVRTCIHVQAKLGGQGVLARQPLGPRVPEDGSPVLVGVEDDVREVGVVLHGAWLAERCFTWYLDLGNQRHRHAATAQR
jgi:hypothetical protein